MSLLCNLNRLRVGLITLGLFAIFIPGCSFNDKTFSKRTGKRSRLPASYDGSKLEIEIRYIGSELGKVIYSVLDEKTFSLINGKGWILMDGRCISKKCCEKEEDTYLKDKCDKEKDSDLFKILKEKKIIS